MWQRAHIKVTTITWYAAWVLSLLCLYYHVATLQPYWWAMGTIIRMIASKNVHVQCKYSRLAQMRDSTAYLCGRDSDCTEMDVDTTNSESSSATVGHNNGSSDFPKSFRFQMQCNTCKWTVLWAPPFELMGRATQSRPQAYLFSVVWNLNDCPSTYKIENIVTINCQFVPPK